LVGDGIFLSFVENQDTELLPMLEVRMPEPRLVSFRLELPLSSSMSPPKWLLEWIL
jgi:hypothetical protein